MTPLELSGLVTGGALLVIAAAGLVEVLRTRKRARQETEALGAALAASEAVTAALSEEALYLSAVLSAVDAVIVLADREGRVRFVNERFEEVFGIRTADVTGRSSDALHQQIARCFRDREKFLQHAAIPDDASRPSPEEELVIETPAHRVLLVSRRPVMQGRKQVGVIGIFRDVTAQREAEQAREQLMAELASRAATDGLTGVANRRAATDALSAEVERARRYRSSFAVALFDIDHFKRINDDFGHEAGDKVLQAFAQVLVATARASDLVARWGGEEFLVILHEAGADDAFAFAERVRLALAAAQPFPILREPDSGMARPVTVSGGVACLSREDDTPEALVRRADEALYEAKRGGRDRILSSAKMPSGSMVPRDRSKRTLPPPEVR